jgi:maltoporin
LLDVWPVDEQNTVGLGAGYHFGDTHLRLHAGINRLTDAFQTQTITVPGSTLGTREVLFLNRHRIVVSARGEHHFALTDTLRLKTVLYGESHSITSGTRQTEDFHTERLPADVGFMAGAEASLYGWAPQNHLNLFLAYKTGLAAYDELGIPYGLDQHKKADRAQQFFFGLSGNYELGSTAGILGGLYTRYFVDADPNVFDRDDAWELGWALRPSWFIHEHVQLMAEANMQYLRPNGLSPETSRQDQPVVFELGLMPAISLGKGSYSRPQLRLIYAVSFLNDAARMTFAPEDPQRRYDVRHYLGVSVEWWFNSTRYPQS